MTRRLDRRSKVAVRDTRSLQHYAAAAAAAAVGGGGAVGEAAIVSQTGLSLNTPTTLNLTDASGNSTVVTFTFNRLNEYGYYNSTIGTGSTVNSAVGIVPNWVQNANLQVKANAVGVMIDGSIPNSSGATFGFPATWVSAAAGTSLVAPLNGTVYGSYVGGFTDRSGYGADVTGYIGIRFLNPLKGNAVNYGWIEYTGSVDGSGLITGWGYDDSGAGILTGAVPVPEPKGLAMLAAGALAGTAAVTTKRWRRSPSREAA
jgi:hypothetical protein